MPGAPGLPGFPFFPGTPAGPACPGMQQPSQPACRLTMFLMEVELPESTYATFLGFVFTSCRMSCAEDLQYCKSLAVCSWMWLTKLKTNGMVTATARMATKLKVTAE